MDSDSIRCVLLADRHHGLTEGVRGLLETKFDAVVMVADETSLFEIAVRLKPALAVVDLSLAQGQGTQWLRRLHAECPDTKLILLSVHDEPNVRRAAMEAGAQGFVLKHSISTELLPAIDAVMGSNSKNSIAGGRKPLSK